MKSCRGNSRNSATQSHDIPDFGQDKNISHVKVGYDQEAQGNNCYITERQLIWRSGRNHNMKKHLKHDRNDTYLPNSLGTGMFSNSVQTPYRSLVVVSAISYLLW